MASIPRPKTSVRPVSGSVGRQRISAPIEAFGGGSGLTELGRGVEALGAGAESVVREQQRKQQQDTVDSEKFKGDTALVNFNNRMNLYVAENINRPDVEKNAEDYTKFRNAEIQSAVSTIKDQEIANKLKLSLERSSVSYNSMMGRKMANIRQKEKVILSEQNFDNAEQKLLISADELLDDSNIDGWLDRNGSSYVSALETKALMLPEGAREQYKKDQVGLTFGKLVDTMGSKIATDESPGDLANKIDQWIDYGAESGYIKKEHSDQLKLRNKKRLASRATAEENQRVQNSFSWVEQNKNVLLNTPDNPAQRQLIIDHAKDNKQLYATKQDPHGNKAFDKIKKMNDLFEAQRQNSNSLAVKNVLVSQGPEAAMAMLEKLEEGDITKFGDRTVRTYGINADQSKSLRSKIEAGYDDALKPIYKELFKELGSLSEQGKLYSATLETGEDFEQLDRKIGESVGRFARMTDWDENQLDGEDLDALADHVEAWADKNDVTDGVRLRHYVRDLLFPKKASAARKSFRMRLRLENTMQKTDDQKILDNIK